MADLDECSWNMVELDYLSILSLDVQLYNYVASDIPIITVYDRFLGQ